jgi:hypothetical protein
VEDDLNVFKSAADLTPAERRDRIASYVAFRGDAEIGAVRDILAIESAHGVTFT